MVSKIGPSYRRVANDLKARITAGEFPVESPIPSTAKLMRHYEVSSTVVRHAVAELQAEGVVIGHSGKAVFVQARPAEVIAEKVDTSQLANDISELQRTISRIEANLIDLYGRSGFNYPHSETDSEHNLDSHERLA